jgi:hypothetical protein
MGRAARLPIAGQHWRWTSIADSPIAFKYLASQDRATVGLRNGAKRLSPSLLCCCDATNSKKITRFSAFTGIFVGLAV